MFKSLKSITFGVVAAALMAGVAHADVTVYTAGPQSLIDKLSAGFTKQTGVKVNVFQATTGKVMARIEAEAANPVVDVVISASWDTANDFAKRGWLVNYSSPKAAKVPDFLKSEGAVAQGISALGIVWNSKSGTPKPSEWADLTKPEYKDLVNIPDPAQSEPGLSEEAAGRGGVSEHHALDRAKIGVRSLQRLLPEDELAAHPHMLAQRAAGPQVAAPAPEPLDRLAVLAGDPVPSGPGSDGVPGLGRDRCRGQRQQERQPRPGPHWSLQRR